MWLGSKICTRCKEHEQWSHPVPSIITQLFTIPNTEVPQTEQYTQFCYARHIKKQIFGMELIEIYVGSVAMCSMS